MSKSTFHCFCIPIALGSPFFTGDPKGWTRCGYNDIELGTLDNIVPASREIGINRSHPQLGGTTKGKKEWIESFYIFSQQDSMRYTSDWLGYDAIYSREQPIFTVTISAEMRIFLYIFGIKSVYVQPPTPREYWMIYRGPGFLADLAPPHLPSVSSTCDTRKKKTEKLAAGKGGKRTGKEPNHMTAVKPGSL